MLKKLQLFLLVIPFVTVLNGQVTKQPLLSSDTSEELTDTLGSQTVLTASDTLFTAHPKSKVDSLIAYAHTFIGNRYRRGGTSKKGFDCSGYTMTVYAKFHIKLPHTSAGQGLIGIDVSKQNVGKGDLILFRGRGRRGKRIGHVGIIISNRGEPVRFIHSSTSEGVRIDRLEYQYYRKRYIKTVRIPELYRNK